MRLLVALAILHMLDYAAPAVSVAQAATAEQNLYECLFENTDAHIQNLLNTGTLNNYAAGDLADAVMFICVNFQRDVIDEVTANYSVDGPAGYGAAIALNEMDIYRQQTVNWFLEAQFSNE